MKKIYLLLKIVVVLYILLLIPLPKGADSPLLASKTPFTWNQDSLWMNLETNFLKAKNLPSRELDSVVTIITREADLLLEKFQD